MKKLVSIVLIVGLLGSQMGCADHRTIKTPLSKAEFPKDYTYTVKLKTQEKIRGLQTDELNANQNKLTIKSSTNERSLMDQDIEYIYGVSNQPLRRMTLEGLVAGGAVGGIIGSLIGAFNGVAEGFSEAFCEDNCERFENRGWWDVNKHFFIPLIVGVGSGAALGGAIGATQKKKNKILITPIVEPTSRSVNTGLNVGIQF